MPKLSHSVPKYRKHKASGQAIVNLGCKDYYLGPHGSKASRIEYDRLIGEWLQRGRVTPCEPADDSLTVVEVITAYLKFAGGYYLKNGKPTRELGLLKEVCKLLRTLYGRTDSNDFGPVSLQVVREKMIALGWTRKYVNKQVGRIVRMFKWATSQELVPPHLYQSLSTLDGLRKGRTEAPDRPPVTPVDETTIDATLAHLPGVVADMVRLQRVTGARPGEICAMCPRDIDRSKPVWAYTPAEHKTEHHDKQRLIFIGPKGQAILVPYLLRAPYAYCFSPRESEKKRRVKQHEERKTPMSCGNVPGSNRKASRKRPPKERYTTASYSRAIRRAAEKAKVETWSPNRVRHLAATEIRRKYGLEAAQVLLGHATADVTQVYAERDMQLAARVAGEVG